MNAFFRLATLFLTVFLSTSITACGPHPLPPPDKVELNAAISVPMEGGSELPVVMARINRRGPFPFILDSGAMGSVFSEKLARELSLPAMMPAAMGRPGSTKPLPATLTRVAKIEIGALNLEGVMAVYADLSSVMKKAPDVQGVLSAGMFQGVLITYDFRAKKIEFRR